MIMLALVFAAVILYDLLFFSGSDKKPETQARPAGIKKERAGAGPGIELRLLDKTRPAYKGVVKDIFATLREEVKKPDATALPAPTLPELPPPPSKFKTFASGLKFLGFLEKEDNKTAFLSKGNDVFIVKKGDKLDGYRVTELTGNLLALTDEASGEHAGIDLQR